MQKNKLVVLNLFKFLDKQDYSTIKPYLDGIKKIVQIILGQHDTQKKENQELYNKFKLLPTADQNNFLNPKDINDVKNVLKELGLAKAEPEPKKFIESKIECESELNKIEGEPEPKKSETKNCLNINNIVNNIDNIGNNNISGNNLLKEEGLKETNNRKESFNSNKAYHEK